MTHPRSYILLPGHDPGALDTGRHSNADLIVFDFEDMVPDAEKPKARLRVRSWLETETLESASVAVRLNAWLSGPDRTDRSSLSGLDLAAVALPKVENVQELEEAKAALSEAGVSTADVHAIIETPAAVDNLSEIASAGAASLWVGAFDLAKALDVDPDPNGTEIFRARQKIAEAAKQAGIPAFDMPFIDQTDPAGFNDHLGQSKYLGFTGCCAVNADQAARINDVFGTDS